MTLGALRGGGLTWSAGLLGALAALLGVATGRRALALPGAALVPRSARSTAPAISTAAVRAGWRCPSTSCPRCSRPRSCCSSPHPTATAHPARHRLDGRRHRRAHPHRARDRGEHEHGNDRALGRLRPCRARLPPRPPRVVGRRARGCVEHRRRRAVSPVRAARPGHCGPRVSHPTTRSHAAYARAMIRLRYTSRKCMLEVRALRRPLQRPPHGSMELHMPHGRSCRAPLFAVAFAVAALARHPRSPPRSAPRARSARRSPCR